MSWSSVLGTIFTRCQFVFARTELDCFTWLLTRFLSEFLYSIVKFVLSIQFEPCLKNKSLSLPQCRCVVSQTNHKENIIEEASFFDPTPNVIIVYVLSCEYDSRNFLSSSDLIFSLVRPYHMNSIDYYRGTLPPLWWITIPSYMRFRTLPPHSLSLQSICMRS